MFVQEPGTPDRIFAQPKLEPHPSPDSPMHPSGKGSIENLWKEGGFGKGKRGR